MSTGPSIQSSRLSAPRPYSPSIRQRNNRSPALGSATQTLTNTPDRSQSPEPLVLRLRGAHTPDSAEDSTEGSQPPQRRTRIQWAEDVIDNEGLGRKKSKVCCIYHKPRPVGESSDESSSDSDSSDSESDSDVGRDGARPVGGRKGGRKPHNHSHGDGCDHDHAHGAKPTKQKRRPSPNAYERMPKYDVKPLARQPGGAS